MYPYHNAFLLIARRRRQDSNLQCAQSLRPHGRDRDLNRLVVHRRAGASVAALPLGAVRMLQPHYCDKPWSALGVSALLVKHRWTVTACRRPPAPAFGVAGIPLPPFSLGSDFRLIAGSAPRSSTSRWGAAHGIALLEARSSPDLPQRSLR